MGKNVYFTFLDTKTIHPPESIARKTILIELVMPIMGNPGLHLCMMDTMWLLVNLSVSNQYYI